MASNYEVNIKLNTRTVNKQLNNLEKRISKLNKLAQGGRANKTVNKNEKDRLNGAVKLTRQEQRTLRIKQKQLKVDQQQLKVEKQTAAALQQQNKISTPRGKNFGEIGGSIGPALPSKTGGSKTGRSKTGKSKTGGSKKGGVLSGALISGAFPLLFGQGLVGGATGFAGGAIGGAIGGQMGGFAGGLVATAGLTLLTNFKDGINELGTALSPANINIDQSIEKLKIINKARAAEIKLIEQFQGSQAALAAITKDTAKVIGNDGVRALREFAETMKLLGSGFTSSLLKIQAFSADVFNRAFTFTGGDLKTAKSNLGPDNALVKALDTTNKAILDLPGQRGMTSEPDRKALFGSFTDFTGSGGVLPLSEKGKAEEARLSNLKKEQELNVKIEAAKQSGARFQKQINVENKNLITTIDGQLAIENRILELRRGGLNPALAKQILLIQKSAKNVQTGFEQELKDMDLLIEKEQKRKNIDQEKLDLLNLERKSLEDQLSLNAQNLKLEKDRVIESTRFVRAAKATQDSFDALRQTVATDLADGIQGLIRGTSTLNQVMNNVLDKMIDAAFNMAFFGNAGGSLIPGSGLFGGLFRAEGGPVKGGNSYVVGERGPEMFTPGVSGTITPNHAMGGSTNVIVNVDASGSSVEGDEDQGRELGRMISVAIQSELIKQKRPGGLLT